MKLNFLLIILIFVLCLCTSWMQDYIVPNDFNIKYSAITRGYGITLEINKDSIHINEDRITENKKFVKTIEKNKSELDQIIKEINQISLDSTYPAPSNKSSYDGGLGTALEIIKDGKKFRAYYDYSNPNISLIRLDSLLKNQIYNIKKK